MKKIGYCATLVMVALLAVSVAQALAMPAVNSAMFHLRVWDNCMTATVTTNNNYATELWIDDDWDCTSGWANLHIWRLSENSVDPALFLNGDSFRIGATLVISGTGDGEAGFNVAPWWSQETDGRFNVRTSDGEIACFGGRLPFYSFTGSQGLNYVKGDEIYLEIVYCANGLVELDPATITYNLTYEGAPYTSGPIAFDEGNPAEPYGTWGMCDNAQVGGYLQHIGNSTPGVQLRATWTGIDFEPNPATATENTSWGNVKSLFR